MSWDGEADRREERAFDCKKEKLHSRFERLTSTLLVSRSTAELMKRRNEVRFDNTELAAVYI